MIHRKIPLVALPFLVLLFIIACAPTEESTRGNQLVSQEQASFAVGGTAAM